MYNKIQDVNECLKLIEICSTSLCDSNVSLLEAEVIIDFLINSLNKESTYSKIFAKNIKERIGSRRTFASDVACFLSNMSGKINVNFNFYKEPSNEDLKEFIKKHIKLDETSTFTSQSQEDCQSLTLKQLFAKVKETHVSRPSIDSIDAEINEFRHHGVLGPILNATLEFVMSIAPTSVESERIFSSCARIASRFRSSMKPDLLNAIMILKKLFKNIYRK